MIGKVWGLSKEIRAEIRERLKEYGTEYPDETLKKHQTEFLNRLPEDMKNDFLDLIGYSNIVMSFYEYEAYRCGFAHGTMHPDRGTHEEI